MHIVYVILLSLGSIITLFILTKIMGYRQMSQLSMFDYINGITIGSIAAEMATSLEDDFMEPLVAMIIYALAAVVLSWISTKSISARKVISGRPIVLLNNGHLYEENFRKSKLDINEFLTQCRISGYFDISQLQAAILEENGHISFLPKTANRPVTPEDMSLTPAEEALTATLIMDGQVLAENLRHSGKDMRWLNAQIHAQGYSKLSEIFLATCDNENTLTIYAKEGKTTPPDILV